MAVQGGDYLREKQCNGAPLVQDPSAIGYHLRATRFGEEDATPILTDRAASKLNQKNGNLQTMNMTMVAPLNSTNINGEAPFTPYYDHLLKQRTLYGNIEPVDPVSMKRPHWSGSHSVRIEGTEGTANDPSTYNQRPNPFANDNLDDLVFFAKDENYEAFRDPTSNRAAIYRLYPNTDRVQAHYDQGGAPIKQKTARPDISVIAKNGMRDNPNDLVPVKLEAMKAHNSHAHNTEMSQADREHLENLSRMEAGINTNYRLSQEALNSPWVPPSAINKQDEVYYYESKRLRFPDSPQAARSHIRFPDSPQANLGGDYADHSHNDVPADAVNVSAVSSSSTSSFSIKRPTPYKVGVTPERPFENRGDGKGLDTLLKQARESAASRGRVLESGTPARARPNFTNDYMS